MSTGNDKHYERSQRLPPRHRQVLCLLASGVSEEEIGCFLDISRHTVHDYYLKEIYKALNIRTRAQLVVQV